MSESFDRLSESFEDILESGASDLRKNFPGMSTGSARHMAVIMMGMAMIWSDADEEVIEARSFEYVARRSARKVPWAVKLTGEVKASVSDSLRKAEQSGADPVDVVMANHSLTRYLAHKWIDETRIR
jgi:hypothetical protein